MKSRKLWLIILISFHLFLLVNLRFEAWPEMILYPWLQSKGLKLFQDIINPYTPILSLTLFAWFKLVGFSLLNLKILTWLTIVIIDLLIFSIAGLPALFFFVLLQPIFDGNGLWFDLFITPILLLAYRRQSPFFLSLAFFIKQSAIYLFILFVKKLPRLIFFAFIIGSIFALYFYLQSNLLPHLYWSYQYPFLKFPFMPGHQDSGKLKLWLLALFPFLFLFAYRLLKTKKLNWLINRKDPAPWIILSLLFIFPRFEFFHFQPALAFLALFFAQISKKLKSLLYLPLAAYFLFTWSHQLKTYWHQPPRFFEPKIIQASAQIPSGKLFIYNAPEQIYYLADKLPPQPWATQFPWYLELPQVSSALIDNLNQSPPDYCLINPHQNQGEFTPGSYQHPQLHQWIETHCTQKVLTTPAGDLYEYH